MGGFGDSMNHSRGNERAIGLLARLERVTESARAA